MEYTVFRAIKNIITILLEKSDEELQAGHSFVGILSSIGMRLKMETNTLSRVVVRRTRIRIRHVL